MDSNGFQSTLDHFVHFPSDTLLHMFGYAWKRVFLIYIDFFFPNMVSYFGAIDPPGGSQWHELELKLKHAHFQPEEVIEGVRCTAMKPMVQTSYINL